MDGLNIAYKMWSYFLAIIFISEKYAIKYVNCVKIFFLSSLINPTDSQIYTAVQNF